MLRKGGAGGKPTKKTEIKSGKIPEEMNEWELNDFGKLEDFKSLKEFDDKYD